MTLIKRLLGRKDKHAVEPMRGSVPARNPGIDDQVNRSARARMEAEVDDDRQRRATSDERNAHR